MEHSWCVAAEVNRTTAVTGLEDYLTTIVVNCVWGLYAFIPLATIPYQ